MDQNMGKGLNISIMEIFTREIMWMGFQVGRESIHGKTKQNIKENLNKD